MPPYKNNSYRAFLFSILSLLFIPGCASLIKPDVKAEAAALRSGDYVLDKTHASLIFKISHLGFSTYVGRFEAMEASLDFDPENPSAASIEAIIDMTSLDIANDDFAQTLMGPDWFAAETYPQAVFRSSSIEVTGENTGRMTGDLTLKGVTAPITMDVIFNGGARDILRSAYIVGFSATTTLNRSDFGVDRFSGVISDDVAIEIEAEFERQ